MAHGPRAERSPFSPPRLELLVMGIGILIWVQRVLEAGGAIDWMGSSHRERVTEPKAGEDPGGIQGHAEQDRCEPGCDVPPHLAAARIRRREKSGVSERVLVVNPSAPWEGGMPIQGKEDFGIQPPSSRNGLPNSRVCGEREGEGQKERRTDVGVGGNGGREGT